MRSGGLKTVVKDDTTHQTKPNILNLEMNIIAKKDNSKM
jgi:hypothetical protein